MVTTSSTHSVGQVVETTFGIANVGSGSSSITVRKFPAGWAEISCCRFTSASAVGAVTRSCGVPVVVVTVSIDSIIEVSMGIGGSDALGLGWGDIGYSISGVKAGLVVTSSGVSDTPAITSVVSATLAGGW